MNWDSAGLMPQIQALIAFPPGTLAPAKTKARSHPYYKKPGRSHNHDTCDSCSQAGDLLCCDTCNASFHLLCINPPLTYEQIPTGGWRCHRCKSTQIDTGVDPSTISKTSKSSRSRSGKKRSAPSSNSTIKALDIPIKRPLIDSSSSTTTTTTTTAITATKSDDKILAHEGNVVEKFFQRVVDIARKMNPEQFILPKEFMNFGAQQFPGAPRPVVKKQPKANKQIIEMENGMVPSPCVLCFVCDTSCRKGPMIRCDSCSACYHFDCLNPPLTGVPQGRWRCQLHTEQVLEQKVLKSLSLTERVALYDKSKQPFDPIQTALNFVTKSQRAKHYYFRSKFPHKGKNATKIPGAVVSCYASTSSDDDELPPWPEVKEKTSNKHLYLVNNNNYERKESSVGISDGVMSLKLLADVATAVVTTRDPWLLDRCVDFQGSTKQQQQPVTSFSNSETHENNDTESRVEKYTGNLNSIGPSTQSVEQRLIELKCKRTDAAIKDSSLKDDDLLEGLDIKTIRSLAALKLRELRSDETIESSVSDTEEQESPPVTSVYNNLNQTNSTAALNSTTNKKSTTSANEIITDEKLLDRMKEEQVELPLPFITLQILSSTGSHKEIKFEGESLTIGRGEDNDLDLREYSSCTKPADEHCIIFYDSVCATWELVNYSPDGTFVNHCLYGCDGDRINRKKSSNSNNNGNNKKANPLQEIVDTTSLRLKNILQSRLNGETKKRKSCPCSRLYCNQKNVWEGGAKLYESTRIQIGCVKMVVSEIGCEGKLISVPVPDTTGSKNEKRKRSRSDGEEDDDDDDEVLSIKKEARETSLPPEDPDTKMSDSDKELRTEGNNNNDNEEEDLASSRKSRPRKKLKTLKMKLLEEDEESSFNETAKNSKATTSNRGRRRGRGVGGAVPARRKRNSGPSRTSKASPKKITTRGGGKSRKRKAPEPSEEPPSPKVVVKEEEEKEADEEREKEEEEEQLQENDEKMEVDKEVEVKRESSSISNEVLPGIIDCNVTSDDVNDPSASTSTSTTVVIPPSQLVDHDYDGRPAGEVQDPSSESLVVIEEPEVEV